MRMNLPALIGAGFGAWYLLRGRSASSSTPSSPSSSSGAWTDIKVAALGEWIYLTAPVFTAPPPEVLVAAAWASDPEGPLLGWTPAALAAVASVPFPPATMPEAALALAVAWSSSGEDPSTDAEVAALIGELLGRPSGWVAPSTVAAARSYVATAPTTDIVAAWVASGGLTAEGEPLTGSVT